MKTRRVLGALFSVLIVLSIAFSMTPFLANEARAASACGPNYPTSGCPWHPQEDHWWYSPTLDCCCYEGPPLRYEC